MNKFMKKIGAVLLAAAVVVSGIAYTPVITEAEDEYIDLVAKEGAAVANTDVSYEFTLAQDSPVYIELYAEKPVGGMLSLFVNGEQYAEAISLTADQNTWTYIETYGDYGYMTGFNPVGVDYTYDLVLNFNEDVNYIIMVYQIKSSTASTAVISNNSIVLTNGFSKTLSVSGGEVASWSSSNKKVATVTAKGKVTGKSAGSAKITATLTDGSVLTCAVSVKNNVYTESKGYVSQVPSGESVVQVYKMSYDKSGNLVLKVRILNNRGYKATKIKKLAITVKNDAGKKVGTYTVKNKAVSISSGNTKDFTFTIKKKDLNIKNADIRTATYKAPGTLVYSVSR